MPEQRDPPRQDDFLPEHQDVGETKGKLSVFGLVAILLLGSCVLVWRCAMPIIDARHQGMENFKDAMRRSDSLRVEEAKAPPPPVSDPLERQVDWDDETGGLLKMSCGFENARDFWECPPEQRIQVRWLGGRSARRLVVVRGFAPVETLLAEATPKDWVRLCSRKDKDVVLFSQGDDPCSARRVRAWSWTKGRMRPVETSRLDCDTSTCSRYRDRGSWSGSAPSPDSRGR